MKNILLIAFSCFFLIHSKAQTIDTIKSVVIIDTLTRSDVEKINNAGWALKEFTTISYVGTGVMLLGGAVSVFGFTQSYSSPSSKTYQTIGWVGVGISGVGAILHIIAPGFINKAGEIFIKFGK